MAQRGHAVTVLASAWPGARARATVDGMDVRRTGTRYTYGIAAPRYYRTELAHRPFDFLIEDLNKVPLFSPLWSRQPVVLLVHHLFGRTAFQEAAFPIAATTWLLERPLGWLYRRVPTEAVSRSTAEDLVRRGFDAGQIAVIPNGVDLEFYSPAPDGIRFAEPTILYLGRLKRYKRIDLILHALERLRRSGFVARAVIAGEGDYASELRRLRAELQLEREVELPGFVADPEKRLLFRRAWVHVLTSPKEGWGITNLEAAACATPTVASDSPGLRDAVRDGETGYLVPHGDVSALADRLGRLLGDASLRERLGRQARSFAEGFSWDRAAERTEAHLGCVLSRLQAA